MSKYEPRLLTFRKVVGGNAFAANMSGDIGNQGTCTTCTFSEDFSNYWTAVMFFKHTNGSYKRVKIMENDALPAGINGGMTIYYTQQDFNSNGNKKITAFPPVRNITLPRLHYMSSVRRSVDISIGIPHDSGQSYARQRGHDKAQGSPLHLSRHKVDSLPRDRRFPQEGLQGRYHDRAVRDPRGTKRVICTGLLFEYFGTFEMFQTFAAS